MMTLFQGGMDDDARRRVTVERSASNESCSESAVVVEKKEGARL